MTEEQEDKANNSKLESDFVALPLVLVHHFSWSTMCVDVHSINGLFEELLHYHLNSIAANASHWARGINGRVVIFSPRGVNLLWIPLSEGETPLLVLHLLSHNVHLSTGNILELNSHVTDLVTQLWRTRMLV